MYRGERNSSPSSAAIFGDCDDQLVAPGTGDAGTDSRRFNARQRCWRCAGPHSCVAREDLGGPDPTGQRVHTLMPSPTMTRPTKLKLTLAPQRRFEAFN